MREKIGLHLGMAVGAVLALTVWTANAQEQAGSLEGDVQALQTGITQQALPLLFYDVTGSTIAGPTHLHLAVYWNGQASISRKDQLLGSDGDRVIEATVTLDQLRHLNRALVNARAKDLDPSLSNRTADLPLKTVSYFLSTRTDALCHTYSYYEVQNRVAQVDDSIQAFIDEVFPGIRS